MSRGKAKKDGEKKGRNTGNCKNTGMASPPTANTVNVVEAAAWNSGAVVPETIGQVSQCLSQSRQILYEQPREQTQFQSQFQDQTNMQNRQLGPTNICPTPGSTNICPPPPPPSYLHSLGQSRLVGQQYNQQTQQQPIYSGNNNSNCPDQAAPLWVTQMLETLTTKLNSIDYELKTQNSKWDNMKQTLHTQSTRMTKIEEKIAEMGKVKQSVSQIQNTVTDMGLDITSVKRQMNDFEKSIEHCSGLCDDIISDKANADNQIETLCHNMSQLQADHEVLKEKQSSTESKVIDIQCRSMCENLIFTGIAEQRVSNDTGEEYENCEQTLQQFLRDEMTVDRDIAFDRVHRLGNYRGSEDYPRPLIAKFERYKDKEYIKMLAPRTLKDTQYGVREQYPKEIEDRRKLLYGEMKKAKRNKNNKVRLIRDRLYINNVEFIPNTDSDRNDKQQKDEQYKQQRRMHNTDNYSSKPRAQNRDRYSGENNRYERSRTFYQRPSYNKQSSVSKSRQQSIPCAQGPEYAVRTTNYYETLQRQEACTPKSMINSIDACSNQKKKKAISPLEDSQLSKRQRELENLDKSPQSDPPAMTAVKTLKPQQSITIIHDSCDVSLLSDGPVMRKEQSVSQTQEINDHEMSGSD